MKCEFVHAKDPSILLQSKEWRAGYEGPFDTEDECRARIKLLADHQEPAPEMGGKAKVSFWCIPYAHDAVPHEFAKEPPLLKAPQAPPNLSSGPPPIQPPWYLNDR
jgi:hypothetical protein